MRIAAIDVGTNTAQPPGDAAVRRAVDFIDGVLADTEVPTPGHATLIGTSGTTVALARINAGPSSTWEALDEAERTLTVEAVHGWRARLLDSTFDAVMVLHPKTMRGRADVFPTGVLILDRFMHVAGLDACRVSAYQLRHGLVLRWL